MNMLAFAALSSAKNVETIASVSTTHAIQVIKNSQDLEKKFWKISRLSLLGKSLSCEVVFLTFGPKLQVRMSEAWKGETKINEMTGLKYK